MAKRRRQAPRRYTLEEKIALVTEIDRRYRAGGMSLTDAAIGAGTTYTSYQNWLQAGIRPRPPEVSQRPAASRLYEPAERERLRAEVDRLRTAGRSLMAACLEVGISEKSYRKWSEDAAPSPAMLPVEVTALVPVAPAPQALTLVPPLPGTRRQPSGEPENLTLVAPGGYSIQGLTVETAAALLRALAC